MATILVTGGAGYIGSHACKALALAGHTPIAYDNLSRGHEEAVKWGPLEVGDIGDFDRVENVLSQHRPVAVMHFAAFAYVGESVERPLDYYRNNVAFTLNLLDAMRAGDVHHFVFSSSCAVYGVPENLPITEDAPINPINPYGAGKRMVEQFLADSENAESLKWNSLRYFNAAGADPDGEIGEDHDPETHLIPRALMAAAGDIDCLDVMGTDYDTPDGTAIRDYIHVSDLADAHVKALDSLLNEGDSGVFNLGAGKGYSVRDIIASVERTTGRAVPVNDVARRPGDPPALVAGVVRASQTLGFSPKFRDIDSIVETAWRWHRRRHNIRARA
jgi:UDP-arabinose 4-epimerase